MRYRLLKLAIVLLLQQEPHAVELSAEAKLEESSVPLKISLYNRFVVLRYAEEFQIRDARSLKLLFSQKGDVVNYGMDRAERVLTLVTESAVRYETNDWKVIGKDTLDGWQSAADPEDFVTAHSLKDNSTEKLCRALITPEGDIYYCSKRGLKLFSASPHTRTDVVIESDESFPPIRSIIGLVGDIPLVEIARRHQVAAILRNKVFLLPELFDAIACGMFAGRFGVVCASELRLFDQATLKTVASIGLEKVTASSIDSSNGWCVMNQGMKVSVRTISAPGRSFSFDLSKNQGEISALDTRGSILVLVQGNSLQRWVIQ